MRNAVNTFNTILPSTFQSHLYQERFIMSSKKDTPRSQAMKFKKFFHNEGKTIFLAVGKGQNNKPFSRSFHGTLKRHCDELLSLNQQGMNIYMLVNSANDRSRKSEDISSINALFIDYDHGDWYAEDMDSFLEKFPIKPHMVVETSPGCFHAYWKIGNAPIDRFSDIQKQLAKKFGSDPKVCDLARVMRVPGTFNTKREKRFMAKIVFFQENYDAISFEKFEHIMFDDELSATKRDDIASTEKPARPRSDNQDKYLRVQRALDKLPADDRSVWVTVGMALKDALGSNGLSIYKQWSSTSSKYDEAELERQWASFKRNGGITIATLFWLAKNQPATHESTIAILPTTVNTLVLAKQFANMASELLRYSELEDKWFMFANGKWTPSKKGPERVAINYLQQLETAAASYKDDATRSLIARCQSHASAREFIKAAESDPALSVNSNAFDQAPHLLGAKLADIPGAIERYAVLDLPSKSAKLARPADMIQRVVNAAYDPSATCSRWDTFLQQITQGDVGLIEFIQEAVGYSLFGHTKEQVMFVLIGSGGNGKGVFTRTIFFLFGEYAAAMQSSLLKPGAINANNPSPALMRLRSKRFWACSEVPKGMVLDEALTKQITGGDIITGRQLYGDQVEFLPVGKLWLSVNTMPRIRHDDEGMWRRIVPIPFDAVFAGRERDNDLEDKLQLELPGILNWALEGARRYAENGELKLPLASKKLLSALRKDADTVGIWVKSRCIVLDDGKIQSQIAYDDYCDTMKMERVTPLPQKEFKADLVRRGYRHKTGRDYNYFSGLGLKDG